MDSSGSNLLPRIVGRNMAKELASTGRVLDAEEAHEPGLFNHIYPTESFESRANDLVGRIANGPPVALESLSYLMVNGAK